MDKAGSTGEIIVGVDGSDASIAALQEAQLLATPLGVDVVATAFWDYPPVYEGYVVMGITGFEEAAGRILKQSVEMAFGPTQPDNVHSRLVQGHPRQGLIEASRKADMIVVGRRGHGGFGGLLLGSVTSACVAHAHCPVLVVHVPEDHSNEATEGRP
ncbi:universal stress protein [Paenarthrobacter sp. RAF54_2]|uniref:universal stress protein n=1 Tax=Paenarthrobacter sp. RAF54_2 TaxID=3233061 RepID=UPI003F9802C0